MLPAVNPPLFVEEEEFQLDRRRVDIYSLIPALVFYMRELLENDGEDIHASMEDLRRINSDPAGRRSIRACILEIDRKARSAAYSSRAPNGLADAIWYVLRDHPAGVEFKGRDVHQLLKADGYRFTAKHGRMACYYGLRTLVDTGRITIKQLGGRGTAAIYQKTVSAQVPLPLESTVEATQ